jgi:rRNA small subunit pseudouridine methyltransferase Nep1
VIKNPITSHLPIGCKKYLTSFNCANLVAVKDVVSAEAEEPVVMVVGGISHGKISTEYTEGELKISNYPLSAALTCAKLTTAFEEMWGVV